MLLVHEFHLIVSPTLSGIVPLGKVFAWKLKEFYHAKS